MISHYSPIQSRGFVVRKTTRQVAAFALFSLEQMYSGAVFATRSLGRFAALMLCLVLVPLLAFTLFVMFDPFMSHLAVGAIPFVGKVAAEPVKPANIRKMEADLKALVGELEQGTIEMAAGPIAPERGEELEQKAKEMETIQGHIDQYNRIAGITSKARQVSRVTLPSEGEIGRKTVRTTAGHLFVMSDAFKSYQRNKQGWSADVDINSQKLSRPVTIRGEAAVAFEQKAFDPATLSSLGDDVLIETQRDPELVRFEEPEILTIRDVLNSAPTTTDSIRFVRHVSTTRAAESQATPGALKKFLKVAFEPTTVNVETIAVLSKVTEQDIDDAPRLVSYINGEMSLDVKVEEERQIVWGSGLNAQLKGLFHADYAIPEFNRAVTGDTLIDTIRRMRTDLRKNERIVPSFVMIDPVDWEEIELAKGSDERYVWGLITDLRGPRIWSLRVVESDAMTNIDTGERRMLMGDGVRGATVYSRNDLRLAVGYMDDDFGRNLRTLRAEERLALAVKRSYAFEYTVTAEASS